MKTPMRTTISNLRDQGAVAVRVSSGAGRLLFALLLSPGVSLEMLTLSTLAGIPKKQLPAILDELILAQEQPLDPANEVETPVPADGSDQSITHIDTKVSGTKYLDLDPAAVDPLTVADPEEVVLSACQAADNARDPKKQALALVDAWIYFFPEVNKVQELQPTKARAWIRLLSSSFPGREATTVFGWLGGVDEKKLLSLDFPLAYVNKMIAGKADEQGKVTVPAEQDNDGDMDAWREYAQKFIEQGATNRVGKNIQGNLQRIVSAVKGSTGQPT